MNGGVDSRLKGDFLRYKFACKCGCGLSTVDTDLLDVLEWLGKSIAEPLHILSGCRCKPTGPCTGAIQQHLHETGRAVDIVAEAYAPYAMYEVLTSLPLGGLGVGLYPEFVHLDVRDSPGYRWVAHR